MARDLGEIAAYSEINRHAKEKRAIEVQNDYRRADEEAKANVAMIEALAGLIHNPRLRQASLDARVANISRDITVAEQKLKMLQAKMMVDTLSFVDPTFVGCDLVSLWMDSQIEDLDR